MSPVNHDPSPDDAVATGRLPLTRRELRARERFLATQNQDLVPPSTYALDDIEQQRPAGPDGDPLAGGHGATSAPYAVHEYRGEADSVQADTTPAGGAEAEPVLPPKPQLPPEPVLPAVPAESPSPFESPRPLESPVPSTPAVEVIPEPAEPAHAAAEQEDVIADGPAVLVPATSVMDEVVVLDSRHGDISHTESRHRDSSHREGSHDDGPHHHEGLHVETAVPQHDHVDDGDRYFDAAAHHDGVHADDVHADLDHADYLYAADDHAGYDAHAGYDPHAPLDNHVLIGDEAVPALPKPSKKVRRRRRLVALLVSLLVFVAVIAIGAQLLRPLLGMDKTTDYPGPGTGVVKISVQPGAGPRAVATTLENQKVVANADAFLKEFLAAGGELSPGDFEFRSEMKNSDAVAILLNRDSSKVMYFALNAGLRIGESLEAISKGSGVPLEQLKALSDSPAQFGVPAKAKNLEGFLAPGEYRFPLGTQPKDILQKLVTTTLDELKAQGITDPAKQYDTITVASIVQAEGGQADYGNVAGAIYNRLKPNNTETSGLIQSDATVTYGLGRKSFHIDEAEKADKSNPYNTYANPGLPAGPIGSPGKSAIDAAAKPTANDYLYWVTINLDTKETKFSKTLAEHLRYVDQYNAWCSANPGRCV